jgi:hypothetical protein
LKAAKAASGTNIKTDVDEYVNIIYFLREETNSSSLKFSMKDDSIPVSMNHLFGE